MKKWDKDVAWEIWSEYDGLNPRTWAQVCIERGTVINTDFATAAVVDTLADKLKCLLREKDDSGLPKFGQTGEKDHAGLPKYDQRELWKPRAYGQNWCHYDRAGRQNFTVAEGLADECYQRYHVRPENMWPDNVEPDERRPDNMRDEDLDYGDDDDDPGGEH